MILPSAPSNYRADDQNNLRAAIRRLDLQNRKKGQDVEIAGSERLILASPDGNRWVLTVDNAGALSAVAL
jgi:hypothetical protein